MKASPTSDTSAPGGATWSIGELAGRLGLATHVLRHWEDVGLLSPRRDGSGYRRYSREDLVRVLTIRSSQAAGMSLDQVRALLDVDSAARHEVLQAHLATLEEQRRELERSRLMTEHALRCQAHDIAQCPRFASYVQDLVDGVVSPDAAVPVVPVVPPRRP
ncbi:MerR family transcriptional regulator [Ornithinimicrobium pratense]|uniref:MerR family transcriptional regulator n=1 Tax=Ornithinimicrobium pratense TaxID=2593973 RepID=A0A5J6V9T1_9MICO|nr:MerR family transcriptional regulator [Ornithinimicrobium pratense]QFG69986.1 MerR family transcriptional regulator [Ornithinimicrobium pratense]